MYDSKADTLEHIKRVSELLTGMAMALLARGAKHDDSKLVEPEKSLFDEETPKLKELVFGSTEYVESLERLQPALEHHYANNSHHPQHYPEGIDGMNLVDIVEMFADWIAASERTKDGDIYTSIKYNKNRFVMSEQLENIFINTVKYLGF